MGIYKVTNEKVTSKSESIPVAGRYDVIVIGGGTAGVSAASAAGRTKIKTLVIEAKSYFGGELSTGGGYPIDGAFPQDKSIGGMMDMILAPVRFAGKESAVMCYSEAKGTLYYHDAYYYRRMASRMLWQSGCQMLLNSSVTDVILEDKCIKGVIVSCEGKKMAYLAGGFIDCTENACVAEMTGAKTVCDKKVRTFALPYILGNINNEKLEKYLAEDPGMAKAVKNASGNHDLELQYEHMNRIRSDIRTGYVYADSIVLEAEKSSGFEARGELEFKAQQLLFEHINFYRAYIPGMENAELIQAADGLTELSRRHIAGKTVFDDTLCQDASLLQNAVVRFADAKVPGSGYLLPYDVMVTEKAENLLVAGKAISATDHVVDLLGRGGRIALGQAAGVASSTIALGGKKNTEIDTVYLYSKLEELGCDLDGEKTRVYRPEHVISE